MTDNKKTLVLIGNDKKGREFIARHAKDYAIQVALENGSRSLKRIVKLLRRGSLAFPVLIKMISAEAGRTNYSIPPIKQVKTNADLLEIIKSDHIERIILYHVGMIIHKTVLQTGVVVLNIHCARLPDYAGLMAIHRAIRAGDLDQEATLHFVNEKVDSGDIIRTIPFRLDKSKSYKANEDIAFQAGEQLLLTLLDTYYNN